MTTRTKCSAAGLVALGVTAITLIALLGSREPSFQGRKLTLWLRDFDGWDGLSDVPVSKALQEIGTNAIPTLLGTMRTRDTRLRQCVIALDSKQSLIRFQSVVRLDPSPQPSRRWRAVDAFSVLGPAGRPAIPALERLLRDADTAPEAASALARIGPETLPLIVQAVTNSNNRIRSGAIFGLAYLGPRGSAAIPALIAALGDQDDYVRASAAWALGLVGANDPAVVPPLLKSAADPSPNVRAKVAESLGAVGISSEPAVAVLRRGLADADLSVRKFAGNSLRQLTHSQTP